MGERRWGSERLLDVSNHNWSFKELKIDKGCKGGLQYHHLKDEAVYVVRGSLLVRYVDEERTIQSITLHEGETVRFKPGCIHQEEALTDCLLIEVSTPHMDDRVRVEEQFGLEAEEGLQSTSPTEVGMLTESIFNV